MQPERRLHDRDPGGAAEPVPAARFADYAELAYAVGADDRGAARVALERVAADPAVATTLRRHHLITLVWRTLGDDDVQRALAPAAVAACEAWLRRPRSSPADDLRTIAEVQAALGDRGVDCMILKGLAFADRLYGDLARRPQYDVDVLVRRRDVAAARRTLAALGYAERGRDLHSSTWWRGTSQIDLHAWFRSAPAYRLDEARIWRDHATYTIGEVAFATPSDADTLVLLALSLLQDVGLGAAKLKQLVDVALLAADVDGRFDWEGFFRARGPEGTLRVLVNVLDLVVRVFDVAPRVPRLAAGLAAYADLGVARSAAEARALVFAARGARVNQAWFFRVYPGSVAWYWLWLLPRKLPAYLGGRAPERGPSAMRPGMATVRTLLAARRRVD